MEGGCDDTELYLQVINFADTHYFANIYSNFITLREPCLI